jgi:conjugative transposon TraM protein
MKKAKQRKMLMVLPVLLLPFLTLGFYALGGGSDSSAGEENTAGLNVQLPDPHLKDEKLMDKLSFYEKARKDSLKMAEWIRSDPYYTGDVNEVYHSNEEPQLNSSSVLRYKQHHNTAPFENTQTKPEEKILRQLSLLEKQINDPLPPEDQYLPTANQIPDALSQEVNRLETMMNMMNKGAGEDPEIKKLESTLDKILDIQHPQRVLERMNNGSINEETRAFTVSESADDTNAEGFYGVLDEEPMKEQTSISAVVHENQSLVNGSVIKLRLQQDVYINGLLIPKDQFVFGIVSLSGERLEIEIKSILSNQHLLPVSLAVYDMDGIAGIYIPGAITRDVAKQSADRSLQLIELTGMDQSLKTQAASAGLNSVKNLISKKIKLVKVMVKAGYKVLLKG